MIRQILPIFFLVFLNQNALGTAQFPDYLIYNGDTLSIFSNPLESYFEENSRPDSIFEKYGKNNTACWRGYVAFWELKNDSLFLLEIKGDKNSIDLSLIFKDRKISNKVFADWFSNSIIHPYGKLIRYEHMAYNSIFEFEKEFKFINGILTEINVLDNSKSIRSKYTQETDSLFNFFRKNINPSLLPDTVERVRVFVQVHKVSPNGKIDSVIVVRGFNEIIDQEAIRVVKLIPEWDVLYQHGELLNLTWTIPVVFEKRNK